MPRKKKGGNRGDSPEKLYPPFPGLPSSGIASGPTFQNYNPPPAKFTNRATSSWVDIARQGIGEANPASNINENDQTFFRMQEMFKGKLEPEVIHMVLAESQFKGRCFLF